MHTRRILDQSMQSAESAYAYIYDYYPDKYLHSYSVNVIQSTPTIRILDSRIQLTSLLCVDTVYIYTLIIQSNIYTTYPVNAIHSTPTIHILDMGIQTTGLLWLYIYTC